MRQLIAFPCEGDTLIGTLDMAKGATGLLIVSGGNEIRIGAHRGMAKLAARIAASGIPVFRYDRRGIGDSTGENTGFENSRADLIAASAAFCEAAPHIERLAAFGNCDAATSLALFHREAGIDRLVLANPWIVDAPDDLPPAPAIRAHYLRRLLDPATYLRAVRGDVDFRKLVSGLRKLSAGSPQSEGDLQSRFGEALAGSKRNVSIVLARHDATAIALAATPAGKRLADATRTIDTASHSFARDGDAAALEAIIRAALA